MKNHFDVLGFSSSFDPGPENAFYYKTSAEQNVLMLPRIIDTDGYDYVYDGVFWKNEEMDLLELFLVGSTSGVFEGQQNAGDYDAYIMKTSLKSLYEGPS